MRLKRFVGATLTTGLLACSLASVHKASAQVATGQNPPQVKSPRLYIRS